MPEIFIDGRRIEADAGQTVMQAARANGIEIPALCWHPALSVPGNCRICMVEVVAEGQSEGWLDIACNMPVAAGMRVLTDSPRVRQRRRQTMQFVTLNHPVDCGICDKAGECTLQDYHYAYNGAPSLSREPKLHATKHFDLSSRIVLDNERCILCTRCVRFTREVSKSHSLGVQDRGDHSLIRPTGDGSFENDAYSDNVIDLCPVGALQSKAFLHQVRVWYLEPTPSVCPGCERGCNIDIWHRKRSWALKSLDAAKNARIDRVTPRFNAEVNGPWVCNKARDLAQILERPRATTPLLRGGPAAPRDAIGHARWLIAGARRPAALVSNGGSNEELAAFDAAFGRRFDCKFKHDHGAAPGEPIQDELLIRADKNPNSAGARSRFAEWDGGFAQGTDLVLVWGEGVDAAQIPKGARLIVLGAFENSLNGAADAFVPISTMTERAGHYTNFEGKVSAFEACFDKPPGVADAQALFAALSPVAALEARP